MENETAQSDALQQTQEAETVQDTQVEAEQKPKTYSEEEYVAIQKQLEDAKKYGENQKTRAEKAEKRPAETKNADKGEDKPMTTKDTIALINAKVSTEDFDSVVDWAKFKNIPVADALKDKTLQVVLREKEEERKTAAATATKGGSRFIKDTPEEIVARASRGELPEDDEGIVRLAEAHHALKMKKIQR